MKRLFSNVEVMLPQIDLNRVWIFIAWLESLVARVRDKSGNRLLHFSHSLLNLLRRKLRLLHLRIPGHPPLHNFPSSFFCFFTARRL